jgi:hypothetical protein
MAPLSEATVCRVELKGGHVAAAHVLPSLVLRLINQLIGSEMG